MPTKKRKTHISTSRKHDKAGKSSEIPQNLEKSLDNLRRVLALNGKINSTLNIDELLGIIMTTSAEVMRAEAASLMLVDEDAQELVFKIALGDKGSQLIEKFRIKMGEGIAGHVASHGESVIVNDTQNDPRFARRFDNATGFSSKAIICVPMRVQDKIIGILQALNPLERDAFSQNDLELFEVFADQAAIAVDNARLHGELVKQEKAKQELKIAHQIQQNFLPDLSASTFPVDIAATSIPALSVGGDFYDVIRLDEKRTGIIIGDVSGKGVPAALYMVRAISDYRYLAPRAQTASELVIALNKALARDSTFGMFITLLYLIVDSGKGRMEYVSAGHHPILRRQKTGAIDELPNEGGVPVGLVDDSPYQQNDVAVQSGDALFVYTDGITEARNMGSEEYGVDRLKNCVSGAQANARAYSDFILGELKEFTRNAPQHDDMTALTMVI